MHALLIGIDNYPGSGSDLSGCVNDVHDWAELLGPECESIETLVNRAATKAGMVRAIKALLNKLAAGDWGVLFYSGHGTWLPDENGDEPDGRDEAFCPYDFDRRLLFDDELKDLLAARPQGSRVLLVTDCCHSGSIHRAIGQNTTARKKCLLPEQLSPAVVYERPRRRDLASEIRFRALRWLKQPPLPGVVHISGCADTEYSYEHVDDAGRSMGAMSRVAREAYAEMQETKASKRTFREWHARIGKELPERRYPQSPQLNAYAKEARLVVPGLDRR